MAKSVRVGSRVNVEAIGEVFNLFNAINPTFVTQGAQSYGAFYIGTLASHTPNAAFMKPKAYAGESGQPERPVGQLGFRLTF